MSAREVLTDEQRSEILNNSIDFGQMLDMAFALGRESVDLAKHDARVGAKALLEAADEAERFHRIGKTPNDQVTEADRELCTNSGLWEAVHGDNRYNATAVVSRWLIARATTATEVGTDG